MEESGLARLFKGKQKKYEVNGKSYLSFTPDIEPLKEVLSMTHLDIEKLDEKLNSERHSRRKKHAADLKAEMSMNGRCPKCTLVPPCKHFTSAENFFKEKIQLFKHEDWLLMSQIHRDELIKQKRIEKRQQKNFDEMQ